MDPSETYAEEILNRFADIIERQALASIYKRVAGKFAKGIGGPAKDRSSQDWAHYRGQGDSYELKDARAQALEIVLGYAGIRVQKRPHHFGIIAQLESDYPDEPRRVENYVAKLLLQDIDQQLAREYNKTFEAKKGVVSIFNPDVNGDDDGDEGISLLIHDEPDPNDIDVDAQVIETTKGAPERKLSARFPLLWMREVEGYSNESLAEKMGVSLATIKRRIQLEKIQGAKDPGNTPTSLARGEDVSQDAPFTLGELQRCDLMRNGKGPKRGHCKWCSRAIRDAAVTEADRWAHKYRDQGNCYCLIKRYVDMALDFQEHGHSPKEFTSYLDYCDECPVDIFEVKIETPKKTNGEKWWY